MTESADWPAVVVAILTGRLGVLIGRPGRDAAVDVPEREDLDGRVARGRGRPGGARGDRGLRVKATAVIGQRIRLRTGVLITYVAAVPADGADAVAAGEELGKVRWVSPAGAGEVMADLAAPVRYYIDRAHSGAGGPGARSCVAERRQRGTRKDTTDGGGGRVNAHPGRQSHADGVVEITFRGLEQQGWSISSDASNRFELECPHGKFRFRWPEALAPRELRADVFRRMNDEHRQACPAS